MVTHRIVQLGDPNLPKFERMIEEMGAQIARRVALVGDAMGLMFYVDWEKVFEGSYWRCSNKVEPVC